jgi:hypothetical protein
MKSNNKIQIAISLALILLIQICQISTKTDNTNKDKDLLKNTITNTNSNTNTNTNSIKSTTTTEKLKTNLKGPSNNLLPLRNSLGHKVKKNSILTKFPMKVKSCDQIAFFPGQYVTDLDDVRLRKNGYYAINAHSLTIYDDKDSNKLIHHVLWANSKKKPAHLNGAKGCLIFDSATDGADVTLCFDSKDKANNVLRVIKDFYKCRMGDNLQPIPKDLIRKLMQVCGANGKIISGKKGPKKFKMNLAGRAGNKWDSNRMVYYQPDPIIVPGTKKN